MFDIADVPFSAVTDDEKQLYASTRKQDGMLQGYTSVQYAVRSSCALHNRGISYFLKLIDNRMSMVEYATSLNNTAVSSVHLFFIDSPHIILVNRDVNKRKHPEALVPLLPEIQEFSKHNYFNVLNPILR